jgi:Heavy metal binding domain
MRSRAIACAAIFLFGCSGEIAERPAAADPTNAASQEAPFRPPPVFTRDPLLSPIPPVSREPPPTGSQPAHSSTTAPPGNAPVREEPGKHQHIYTCPMHPEVRSKTPGQCPRCGMTLVPLEATGESK